MKTYLVAKFIAGMCFMLGDDATIYKVEKVSRRYYRISPHVELINSPKHLSKWELIDRIDKASMRVKCSPGESE